VAFGVYAAEKQERGKETLANHSVRVRLTAKQSELTFRASEAVTVSSDEGEHTLPAAIYSVRASDVAPAKQRFHLFIKTFRPSEANEARQYLAQWKQQGYEPELITFGRQLQTESGKVIDGRSLWVSVARLNSMEKATALKAKLDRQEVFGWIVPETTQQGKGLLTIKEVDSRSQVKLGNERNIKDVSGKKPLKVRLPARLRCERPIEIRNIDFGFWQPQRANRSYSGILEIAIGPDGLLEVYETLPIEDYLAGVLPAEMPAEWPVEALKAQAVSARSEVISSLAGKHMLEGFDFCGTEHCRAYLGAGGREKTTDRAVADTAGVVLAAEGRVLPAVFSANCGGWTEDNEGVWSAPPNPALRGVPDFPSGKNGPSESGIAKWLRSPPPAYCSANSDSFRWVRKFTARELRDIVNRRYPVGDVRSIELGDRGASGRLKWVKIIGSKGTQVVRKELNIRLAFGGLKSAMFMVDIEGRKGDPASFTFIGGGRGHGVGLCQDGARARALAGAKYRDILGHYFSRSEVVRMR
jgi:SpoIID/LytB domain protein